jgi:hypothetical protein
VPLPVQLAAIERAAQLGVYARAPVATRAGGFDTGSEYARLVYARPATILRTIDGAFDGAGSRAVARYAREQRFAHPGPDALVDAVRREGGEVAAAFAHTALFDKGWVDFEMVSAWSTRQDDGVHRGEIVVARRGDLVLPVEIEWTDADGERGRVSWAGDSDFVRLPYAGKAALRAVQADPDQRVLLDESRRNDALSVAPSQAAPRTLVLSSFASALLFHAVSP